MSLAMSSFISAPGHTGAEPEFWAYHRSKNRLHLLSDKNGFNHLWRSTKFTGNGI